MILAPRPARGNDVRPSDCWPRTTAGEGGRYWNPAPSVNHRMDTDGLERAWVRGATFPARLHDVSPLLIPPGVRWGAHNHNPFSAAHSVADPRSSVAKPGGGAGRRRHSQFPRMLS